MKLSVPEWKQMFDTGKRVGFIYGCDKPRLVKENGKFIKYPERYITHGSWLDGETEEQSNQFMDEWLGIKKPELKIVKDIRND
jgi:hypothetical protein